MTIKELREKAARAVKAAEDIRDNGKPWDAEKQTSFDAAVAEALSAKTEADVEEARGKQMEQLADMGRWATTAVNPVNPQKAAETASALQPNEVFSIYVENAKVNQWTQAVEVPGLTESQMKTAVKVHHEVFMSYMKGDADGLRVYAAKHNIGPKEIYALLSNDGPLGGFLVPEDWRAEVLRAEAGYAILAALCRVEPTNSNELVFPKLKPHTSDSRRISGFTGKWQQQGYVTGGTAPTVQNQPTFQRERIPVHDWQPDAVEISPQLLEDSGANVEKIIADAIANSLAMDKDDAILNGTGVSEPEGVLRSGASTVNSGDADGIAYGGMIAMFAELPAQYRMRATWIMASRTMGSIIQLNTGTGGVYLFPPNQWNDTILSRPVKFVDYGMDTATAAGGTTYTAAQKPVIFGDFSKYIIAQRASLRIQRLVERYAPNIGILASARLGGQVILTDAFRIMTVAA